MATAYRSNTFAGSLKSVPVHPVDSDEEILNRRRERSLQQRHCIYYNQSSVYFALRKPILLRDRQSISIHLCSRALHELLCCEFVQAKCKQALDPTPEDIKRLCGSLRRRAKVDSSHTGHAFSLRSAFMDAYAFNIIIMMPSSYPFSHLSPKDEPAVFHYNGHGVPRPTTNGEIWVFNKNYTQYLPVSIYDLQSWIGG